MQIERIVPTENDIESPTFTVKNYTDRKGYKYKAILLLSIKQIHLPG